MNQLDLFHWADTLQYLTVLLEYIDLFSVSWRGMCPPRLALSYTTGIMVRCYQFNLEHNL